MEVVVGGVKGVYLVAVALFVGGSHERAVRSLAFTFKGLNAQCYNSIGQKSAMLLFAQMTRRFLRNGTVMAALLRLKNSLFFLAWSCFEIVCPCVSFAVRPRSTVLPRVFPDVPVDSIVEPGVVFRVVFKVHQRSFVSVD